MSMPKARVKASRVSSVGLPSTPSLKRQGGRSRGQDLLVHHKESLKIPYGYPLDI